MKKILTRIIVLVFIVATLSAFFVPGVSAIQIQNKRQQAVVETAVAYFNRGEAIQYESIELTDMARDGSGDYANQRETEGASPEDATMSDQMYSVCSAFCWEVYNDTLGKPIEDYQLFKTAEINRLPKDNPMVVYRYSTKDKDNTKTLHEAIAEAWSLMQPGDIINSGDPSGHAMMFVGDYLNNVTDYIIHCAGGKYDVDLGRDTKEASFKDPTKIFDKQACWGGAIKRETAYKFCFDLSGSGGYDLTKHQTFTILRPLNVFTEANSPLSASAQARLKYPGLVIDRQATKAKHQSVVPGEDITVTIKIENRGDKAWSVPVTEVVPANASLKSGSVTGGGSASGNNIKWTVSAEPGEEKVLTYTVTATGKRGDVIRLEGGNVAGIRSNSIPVTISGKGLTEAQTAKLQDINSTANRALFNNKGLEGVAFANAVYADLLGIGADLPSLADYRDGVVSREKIKSVKSRMIVLQDATAETQQMHDLMIPNYIGGTNFYAPTWRDRLLHLNTNYTLQAGDVVLMNKAPYSGGKDECYVVLGDGKVAFLKDDKLKVADANKTLEPIFSYQFFVGLRPALAYDDMSTLVPEKKLPFTDVKEADWFYSFVKELYTSGVVAGQTATTFNPNGNLTYAAALKLLVVGLTGSDAGNATGSHWATNDRNAAKSNGWTDIDASKLDSPITREAFCVIAAKAKNLTKQPAANKFTDTANTSVLALVEAGVINGMSETTFQPAGILTRAQISKIISLLLKL